MTNFIPIFPLNIVVFPNENLNLHIFEDRYKQLIQECFAEKKIFGIPLVINGKITDIGTSVKILSIETEHENGELDIKTIGVSMFTILETIQEIPDKLYKGAIVNYPDNNFHATHSQMKIILHQLRQFHLLLEVSKNYKKPDEELISYDIAHHVGLSLEQEKEFLQLLSEDLRQAYILQHLKQTIPTIVELQKLKERIKLNGHFRKLSIEE